jgi:hypothetical protein
MVPTFETSDFLVFLFQKISEENIPHSLWGKVHLLNNLKLSAVGMWLEW